MTDLVQIAPRLIAAAYEFQAKADSRYMLQGMLLETDTLVTTDGKGMFVAELGTGTIRTHALTETVIVALPSKFIAECRKLKYRDETDFAANLLFDFETGEHFAYVTGGARFPFTVLEGIFPDWRAVLRGPCVDADRNPEQFTMQGYLLEAVGKAAKLLMPNDKAELSGAFFSPREKELTIVRFHHAPDAFAVLMPMYEKAYALNDALPVSLDKKEG